MEAILAAAITTAGGVFVAWLNLNKKHKEAIGVLGEINAAVNNVGTDDVGEKAPPLWKRIDDQTAALGRVEGKLDVHIADRRAHD